MTPAEVWQTPAETVEELWQAVTVLEAREALVDWGKHDWPNLGKSKRQENHLKMFRLAYPSQITKRQSMSWEQLAQHLGQGGARG